MRYRFRGFRKDTGSPVEGHVEAAREEDAFEALGDYGIITETLAPDPKSLNLGSEAPQSPEFHNALDSALDSSSMQVPFDNLTERYRGKNVWVIDRDKIRRRVAEVVDAALAVSMQRAEGAAKARERVAVAIHGLFADNRNIASEMTPEQAAARRAELQQGELPQAAELTEAPTQAVAQAVSQATMTALDQQIGRLTGVIKQAEGAMAALVAAARRGGGGGGGGGGALPRRFVSMGETRHEVQNDVLLEIFKHNMDLQRGVSIPGAEAMDQAADALSAVPASESASRPAIAMDDSSSAGEDASASNEPATDSHA